MTALLEVADAKVHFGGIKAVDGIDMNLETGLLYGIVGPNGSGKTTLVNAITKIYPLTDGVIRFGGRDIADMASFELNRVGMARTYQAIRLLPDLTVRENVMLGADQKAAAAAKGGWRSWAIRGRTVERASAQAADAALERLDLGDYAAERPSSLPYGVQRRVEIARAVASNPSLVLLDEPVAGMNREERREIGAVISGLRADGLTLLLIEHDLRMVLELSDYLFVMNFGKCIAHGEPTATASLPDVQLAYLGRTRAAA